MDAEALVLDEVGVVEQYRPFAFREVALEHGQTAVGFQGASLSGVEQEQVVPCLVVVLVVGIVGGQACQHLLAQLQVVEFVLDDDAGMVETVLDGIVAGCHLFLRKGYLCQVVFTIVRILGGRVCQRFVGVVGFFLWII